MTVLTHKVKSDYTLQELQGIIRGGNAREFMKEGDQISVIFDGKVVMYDVIGIDAEELVDEDLKHSVTLQAHTLIEERPFDTTERYGSNVWETSELREYLQSDEFKERYEELVPYLAKVKKQNSNGEKTEDLFFILSKEEFEPETTPYEYYKDKANRVKMDEDGYTDWHHTRSATRGNSYNTWYVSASGYVYYNYAINAYRCAPACTLA